MAERQSARMSEIKKCRLELDGIDHFYKGNHLMLLHAIERSEQKIMTTLRRLFW